MEPKGLRDAVEDMFDRFAETLKSLAPDLHPREIGFVTSVSTGIAKVSGLPGAGYEELIEFPGNVLGIAFNVDEDEIAVVLLDDFEKLQAGDEARRTRRVMDVAVGETLLGRIIDPLGRPLDGGSSVAATKRLRIERPAAAIMDRAPVTAPLQTGIKVIDALIPIGRGQRELILGDRQTGKTAIALDTILNQKDSGVICVYCAIGQRASSVAKAIAVLRERGALEHTIVVMTKGNDAPGLAYIAPYAATSIAEYFMEAGRDVLIVYDDLTQHAQAYRELSLLLRRPPGREAFPGDIFYIHSRLLERATHLRAELGGGSLTALPIVETEAQNISAYIPTNLISITDGQIYLSPSLFELGVLPAVDVGRSVSRVGGKAQRAVYREAAGDLKLVYAQFEELETFARFGARLDDASRKVIEHGRRVRAVLRQSEFSPVSVPGQIAILLALTEGLFDEIPLQEMARAERALLDAIDATPKQISAGWLVASKLPNADRNQILALAHDALAPYRSNAGEPLAQSSPSLAPPAPVETISPPPQTNVSMAEPPAPTDTKPKSGRKAVIATLLVFCALGGWFAFRPPSPSREPQPATQRELTITAQIVAIPSATIDSRLGGKLEVVDCAVGMTIEKGRVCAKIDSSPYRAAIRQREARLDDEEKQLRDAEAELTRATQAFERLERSAGRRALPKARIETSRKNLQLDRESVEKARAAVAESGTALAQARDSLEKTTLVAPISGVVIARNAEVGRDVEPGQPIKPFVIAATLDVMRIEAEIDKRDASKIVFGEHVSFLVKSLSGRVFFGDVVDVTPEPGANAGRVKVTIEAPNPDLALRPGMEAEVRFPLEKRAR